MWHLIVTVKREYGRSPYQHKLDVPVWLEITFPSNEPVEGIGSHITEGNMDDFWIPYSSEEECKQAWTHAFQGSTETKYKMYV